MPMNSAVRNVKMNACRKATKISSSMIATLPATTTTPIASPPPTPSAAAAVKIRPSSTPSRMWPAIMLAKSRTASAKVLAPRPMISTGTSSGASQSGPGQKCRM